MHTGRSPKSFLYAAFAGICLLFAHSVTAIATDFERLEIITKSGVHVFEVEIAKDDDQRAKGLMFRKGLPEGQGMLFDFPGEGPITMWMKNTYVSLDMIFIRRDGRISHIAENTMPLSEATISSNGPAKGVLEVVAGTSRRLGIAPGDRVAHRFFRGR